MIFQVKLFATLFGICRAFDICIQYIIIAFQSNISNFNWNENFILLLHFLYLLHFYVKQTNSISTNISQNTILLSLFFSILYK